jgi:hypothetical protein
MNVFVFDIETVPDVEAGMRFYDLPTSFEPRDIANAMKARRREAVGHDFLKLHLQRIVAISVVLCTRDQFKVWSLGDEQSSEKELIERFFTGIAKYRPTLVSWNGGGFDLPVLNYRAMRHQITADVYWDLGEIDQSSKWNNYINRYHLRHTDLMDVLSLYQAKACVALDEMATLLGYPGKMGMSGAKVWDAYVDGELKAIRDYCETDVLNTYLVYLHFLLLRGHLNHEEFVHEQRRVAEFLQMHNEHAHFQEFLEAWSDAPLENNRVIL